MAAHEKPRKKRSASTLDRGLPGAYEGETVTRRRFMELNALTVGGIASAAFGLPALGFAVGPIFERSVSDRFQDVGAEADFNPQTYVPKVISIQEGTGEAGKTTVYIRKRGPQDRDKLTYPYVAISTRCAHLGCPVRFVQASERFICPCHGGIYESDGKVAGGPPVRPLDRFETKVAGGRVLVGARFSLDSKLRQYPARDPSNHLDGLWKILYPPRPSVPRPKT
jgi:menaquinol-cytochrome c reductase iron-sulfur subunit